MSRCDSVGWLVTWEMASKGHCYSFKAVSKEEPLTIELVNFQREKNLQLVPQVSPD